MNDLRKHESNERGRLLFSSEPDTKGNYCEIHEHVPGEEELHYYKNSEKEPLPFIEELMEYKSKEEQFLATDNFMRLVNLAERINTRIENEKERGVGKSFSE